jgi:hypothetical protein
MRFTLRARISTDNPVAVKPVLARMFLQGTVAQLENGDEFVVEGVLEGSSARELNRSLLSELRRVEKRTRLRSEWTSRDATERFFDYVPKGTKKVVPASGGARERPRE